MVFGRLITSLLILLCGVSEGKISVTRIISPKWIEVGGSAILECEWRLQQDSLYSVKWYQGIQEIYRYVPGQKKPAKIFRNEHLLVDVSQSQLGRIHITNVTLGASGTFQCEVSGNAPIFYTDYRQTQMQVVALPKNGPVIQGLTNQYKVNDLVNLTCVSSPSYPPAYLTFLINGEQADLLSVEPQRTQQVSRWLHRTILKMQFQLREHMLRTEGFVRVRCQAKMEGIYEAEDEKLVRTAPRYRAFIFGGAEGVTGQQCKLYLLLPLVTMFLK